MAFIFFRGQRMCGIYTTFNGKRAEVAITPKLLKIPRDASFTKEQALNRLEEMERLNKDVADGNARFRPFLTEPEKERWWTLREIMKEKIPYMMKSNLLKQTRFDGTILDVPPNKIEEQHWLDFYKQARHHEYVIDVRVAFRYAKAQGYIPLTTLYVIQPYKKPKPRPKRPYNPYTPEELANVMNSLHLRVHPEEVLILALAAYAGFLPVELDSLHKHASYDDGVVSYRGKPRRMPLCEALRSLLEKWKAAGYPRVKFPQQRRAKVVDLRRLNDYWLETAVLRGATLEDVVRRVQGRKAPDLDALIFSYFERKKQASALEEEVNPARDEVYWLPKTVLAPGKPLFKNVEQVTSEKENTPK